MIEFYGDPVDLYGKDQNDLLNKIIDCLEKPHRDREREYRMNNYTVTEFIISNRDFYRVGWVMTNTDMVSINKRIEDYIKWQCRLYLTLSKVKGIPIKIAIPKFQEEFNLPEDVMSYDLIYKDFLRSQKKVKSNPIFKINF